MNLKKCCQCGLLFKADIVTEAGEVIEPDGANEYADWCDSCFCDLPLNLRYRKVTVADLVRMDILHEQTALSLKQRALDKKNKVGKTTGKKKGGDEGDDSGGDALIFNEPTD